MLALVNGVPKILPLKEVLKNYIDFQIEFFLNEFGNVEAHGLLELLFGIKNEEDAPNLWKLFESVFFDCGTDKIVATEK